MSAVIRRQATCNLVFQLWWYRYTFLVSPLYTELLSYISNKESQLSTLTNVKENLEREVEKLTQSLTQAIDQNKTVTKQVIICICKNTNVLAKWSINIQQKDSVVVYKIYIHIPTIIIVSWELFLA